MVLSPAIPTIIFSCLRYLSRRHFPKPLVDVYSDAYYIPFDFNLSLTTCLR